MKRRITIEQLNELTDEQKQKLCDWWKPEEGDYFVDQGYVYNTYNLNFNIDYEFNKNYQYVDCKTKKLLPKVKKEDVILFSNCCRYDNGIIENSEFSGRSKKEDCLPLLDISQMIEFIYNYDDCFDIDSSGWWYLNTRCIIPNIRTDDLELCDALWNAVKIILGVYCYGK